jgi:hypothetical protein
MRILASYCWAMARDVHEAEEELKERIEQFYRIALSVKKSGDDRAHMMHRRSQPFRRILQEVAD